MMSNKFSNHPVYRVEGYRDGFWFPLADEFTDVDLAISFMGDPPEKYSEYHELRIICLTVMGLSIE